MIARYALSSLTKAYLSLSGTFSTCSKIFLPLIPPLLSLAFVFHFIFQFILQSPSLWAPLQGGSAETLSYAGRRCGRTIQLVPLVGLFSGQALSWDLARALHVYFTVTLALLTIPSSLSFFRKTQISLSVQCWLEWEEGGSEIEVKKERDFGGEVWRILYWESRDCLTWPTSEI